MKKSTTASTPVLIALAVNLCFAVFVVALAIQSVEVEGVVKTRWLHFLDSPPNEIGDTLAGVFGSMTLIWIVASVFQQSIELRAQRHEFEAMVAAQEAQVLAMEAQADFFRNESRRADQKEAFARFNNEIREVLEQFLSDRDSLKSPKDSFDLESEAALISKSLSVNYSGDGYRANDSTVRWIVGALVSLSTKGELKSTELDFVNSSIARSWLSDFKNGLLGLQAFEPSLSLTARKRLDSFNIPSALSAIDSLETLVKEVRSRNQTP